MTRDAHDDIEDTLEWEEWNPNENSFLCHMVAGSFAGVTEHTLMYPVDTLKTHVQCDRCGKIARPGVSLGVDGCVYAMKSLVRSEGVLRLWRGVSTMFAGCIPAHAAYFTIFEEVKRVTGAGAPGHHPLAAASAGVLATLAHDAIMGPMDTVKQRLQLGHYSGPRDCVRQMLAKEGVRSFFLSLPTTLAMNLPFGAIMVTANESFKTLLAGPNGEQSVGTYLLAGSGAGGLAAAATTPLDMIKTRLQTQHLPTAASGEVSASPSPTSQNTPFMGQQTRQVVTISHQASTAAGTGAASSSSSSVGGGSSLSRATGAAEAAMFSVERLGGFREAARSIYLEFGAAGFFRGLAPRLLVSAPSVAVSWTAYEYGKRLLKDKI